MKKSSQISNFIRKMRYKYRIGITNEDTLEEVWYTRLSRFTVFLFFLAAFLFTFTVITLIVFATPLRHYLPGYQDAGNRIEFIQQSLEVDSISREVQLQSTYLDVVKKILKEEPIGDTIIEDLDTAVIKYQAIKLVERSKAEENFVKEYEESEKYNLAAIPTEPTEDTQIFFRPVSGVVASTYHPQNNKFGISIITAPQETVKSVLEGSVISAGYSFDKAWVIHVQHDNGYISIYKNNTKLLKKAGDKVKAGESLAITGKESESESNVAEGYFYFEIWHKGVPINPQEVITFRY